MFCTVCGEVMQDLPGAPLRCERGDMELSIALDGRLRRFLTDPVPPPREAGLPFRVGGKWFCPACGVPTQELSPGDVRCPQCERSLTEIIPALAELHPHRQGASWLERHFHLDIRAPRGLAGIEQHLATCRMTLVATVSNFNGQVLLRTAPGEERFEFQMDPSQTDIIAASGQIYLPEQEAWDLLLSLSEVLKQAGFPHLVGMDSPCGQRSHWTRYDWPTE